MVRRVLVALSAGASRADRTPLPVSLLAIANAASKPTAVAPVDPTNAPSCAVVVLTASTAAAIRVQTGDLRNGTDPALQPSEQA